LVDTPEQFDVVVLPNLYGDILSDVAAQMAGSVGLAGSANIGVSGAMFEAIHGSAPDIAGHGIANPSGLLQAAVMMLHHLGQAEAAVRVQNAWLATLEAGLHTADMVGPATRRALGTHDFADAVIDHLGKAPGTLRPAIATEALALRLPRVELPPRKLDKEMVGVDVFLDWRGAAPAVLAAGLNGLAISRLRLSLITSRGVKVWPEGHPETALTDHWRCRFMPADGGLVTHAEILALLGLLEQAGYDFIKTETLCTFDDQPGFSLGQGQ
jgi:isocitrate dehydrogenase